MAEKKSHDLVVIGAGPGGYVAAIRAAGLGLSVGLIEKENLGGTCLNVGCIPTKTLLANTQTLKKIKDAKEFGIVIGNITFDFSKMTARKNRVVEGLRTSLEGLIKAHKITTYRGVGKYTTPREIKVTGQDNVILKAPKSIIATGSEPLDLKAFPCDHKKVFNSTSILDLTSLPKKIAIVGGGYIGCEFASLYAEMGVEVVILEALSSILPLQPTSISEALTKAYDGQKIEMQTNVFVQEIDRKGKGVKVILAGGKSVDADIALVAVGRKIVSNSLGLEKAGVAISEKGEVIVNDLMETNVPGIYAIGDVVGKWMLAHVASHQGIVAAENVAGHEKEIHYNAVPAVIFTTPEIAMVGMSIKEAIDAGHAATVGKYPFQVLGKSQATHETEGFVQIVTDKNTGQVLGAQVVGSEASVLIGEMTLAIQNELTLDCVIETIHAHPTVAEAWLEAALLARETPIHFPPQAKK